MSLVCSLAHSMVMQKVETMESCWVEMLELCLDQPTDNWMEMSLVCLMVERLDMQMVLMMEIGSVQLKEKH